MVKFPDLGKPVTWLNAGLAALGTWVALTGAAPLWARVGGGLVALAAGMFLFK